MANTHSYDRRTATRLAFAAMTALTMTPAWADVIEIDGDGAAHVRAASGAVSWAPLAGAVVPGAGLDEVSLPDGALTTLANPVVPTLFAPSLHRAADLAGISPVLLEAVVWQESRWHPGAVSRAGALGLGQLMPATARNLGVDPRDPEANLIGAARYLRAQLDTFGNNLELALAAYNAGPARVQRAGRVPDIAETRTYVAQITARLAGATRLP